MRRCLVIITALSATVWLCAGPGGCKRSASQKGRSQKMVAKPLTELTPREAAGWRAVDRGREFRGKSVFEALNGGAEIYLDYGFRRLLVRTYKKPRRPTLSLHVFEVGAAYDAFGLFTHEREGEDAGVGAGSDYAGGLLRFWKGRHFVTVLAPRETPEVKRAILQLGRAVAARLPAGGRPPPLVARLPRAGRLPGSERYLHTHAALMHHLRLGSENVLGLDRRTAVALASYGASAHRLRALLVRYPEAGRARAAAEAAGRWRPPKTSALGGTALDVRFAARPCGRYLAAAWGGGAAADRKRLLARLAKRVAECGR